NVSTPIDFGWQANANSWHRVADSVGLDPALPRNFNINRKDQKVAGNQGPESAAIVGDGSKSTSNASFDALVTPIATAWADYPPQIKLGVTMSGKSATLKATATDDKDTPRVEFFVDWDKVATMTAPPYEVTVDLSNHPRKYAYIYARAFDDTVVFEHRLPPDGSGKEIQGPYQQRAYSQVTEIGPEFLVSPQAPPAPAVLNAITLAPAVATALPGGSIQFSAAGSDQYGNSFPINPTWKVSGGGSVSQSGLLNAGSAEGGPFSVSATVGSVSGSASFTVEAQPGDSRLAVSNLKAVSGKAYQVVDGLSTGSPVYIDRRYAYTDVPVIIQGKTYVRTANDDKNRTEVPSVSFSVDRAVRVYVAYDARASALPSWLRDWANTGQTLESTDVSLELYVKDFAAGSISLGGNLATGAVGAGSNYTLAIADQDGPIDDVVITVPEPATLASITVDPANATALPGGLVQFTATGQDQDGAPFLINPAWEVTGGGSIDQSGLLTAGTAGGGPFTVTASQGLVSGTATVSLVVQLVLSDLTVASSQAYQVLKGLKVGDSVYIDRTYTYISVPATIQGATYLQTANIDKNRTEPSFLAFSVNRAVTVYVAYDSRATSLPAWLAGWSNTGSTLNNTDVLLDLYAKEFAAGPITLGGNLAAGAAGAGSNYSVAIVPM
ncbi:MAG TPA: Ig-like domain-containing protein, partial [Dehalococcoidia bacterium]|nr:Ig-like domain-containing protein [Dehalococcoidia bacterium]